MKGAAVPWIVVDEWSDDVEEELSSGERLSVAIAADAVPPARLAPYADRLERLSVASKSKVDLSFVSSLRSLKYLSIPGSAHGIDYAELVALEECWVRGASSLRGLAAAPRLRDLTLDGITQKNLVALEPAGALTSLFVSDAKSLTELTGIERCPLRTLRIQAAPRLRTVAALAALDRLDGLELLGVAKVGDLAAIGAVGSLAKLGIQGPDLTDLGFVGELTRLDFLGLAQGRSRAAVSLAPIARLPLLRHLALAGFGAVSAVATLADSVRLESLVIQGSGEVESLAFLARMRSLEHLALEGVTIADGKLDLLLELPSLVRVHAVTPHLPHYSHHFRQIDDQLAERHPNRSQLPPRMTLAR